jgi:tRNA-uridine 2-sulfurtransferase
MSVSEKKKVAVAMSGGVDSSVTAALLQAAGHEVIGITMSLFAGSGAAVNDARRVAAHLGIPHHVAAFEGCFAAEISSYFVAEYRSGRTPNPCARCNRLIKFGALFDLAGSLGAECLATGHYARIIADAAGGFHLRQAVNLPKDQTYFLFSLSSELLPRVLFPLGEVSDKGEVRRIAAELGIPVAQKDDSQDICFIPDNDYIGYLERSGIVAVPGDFVLADGMVIGRHQGLHRYTVGQRRGMGIAWSEPLYVIRLEPDTNRVVVGTERELFRHRFIISNGNWLQPGLLAAPELTVKLRYRHRGATCRVRLLDNDRAEVEFAVEEKGVTPGQVAVFYKDDEVVGGGWIE